MAQLRLQTGLSVRLPFAREVTSCKTYSNNGCDFSINYEKAYQYCEFTPRYMVSATLLPSLTPRGGGGGTTHSGRRVLRFFCLIFWITMASSANITVAATAAMTIAVVTMERTSSSVRLVGEGEGASDDDG